ncbi:MAG: isoprenylcysteine carboxylmethyltransferase family protein [Rhizobiales bacterium]|nr:isoprenylcysteine carboxylmethyltransferase family protein [Hyphomicrobiales bacterium]
MPFPALFAAPLMGCYIAAFLVLTARSARDAGQPVWLFGRDRRQDLPALLFRLAFASELLYSLMLAFGVAPVGEFAVPPMPLRVAGLLLALAGALFAIHAQHHMGASWRIGSVEGHSGAIVDTGPFRLSRNPVFVGQALLFGGLLFVLPSLVQAAITLALLIAIQLQVAIEERVLEADLGNPYRAYKQRVHRWLGSSGLKTEGT